MLSDSIGYVHVHAYVYIYVCTCVCLIIIKEDGINLRGMGVQKIFSEEGEG